MRGVLPALLLTLALLCSPLHAAGARHTIRHGFGLYRITGYLWTGNRTATGTWPRYGEVAVDPSVIPLGAWVHIDGLGDFHAEDTGGFRGRWIDVFTWSLTQAYSVQGTGYRMAYWYR